MIKFKLDKEEYGFRPTMVSFDGEFIIRTLECMQLFHGIAHSDYGEKSLCDGECKKNRLFVSYYIRI